MSAKRAMTLRAQWLGRELRRLRETCGLTLKEVGGFIQRDGGTVSRIEAGIYPARTPDVLAMLDLYGVTEPRRRDGLLRLAHEVWQSGWWDSFSEDLSGTMVDYAWVESRARRIRSFDALVIPGLLQTRPYMEAVQQAVADFSPVQISSGIRFRLTRQQILTDRRPPHIEAILDESLLRRQQGGKDVLRDQLHYIATLAAQPHIEVRVLPFASGAHASPEGAFRIFEMSDPYPDVVYMDTPGGGIYMEGDEVRRFILKFDHIRHDSLTVPESIALLHEIAEKLR
ncbi:helix-turn-helix transcriptional regulator [Sphaerisporangium rubeum]|uniref:Transcriptional regulator with XRE-family HTH domain n=1 Tax=Sphaerisporangium rubeum TaxID=321317 RepID=A0A7X0M8Q7_9ACTN|nr:helix-turn-helix transcriptional regulator [Sphaerisporangium rubeum]MBB6474141.1 transcriptional regulator with XRE-family HTH domain [Sphaerisporangium rubeum]